MSNTVVGAGMLQGFYAIVRSKENAHITACNGRLPHLTDLQREHNALAAYALGSSDDVAYFVPNAACTAWVKNKTPSSEKYTEPFVDYVYQNLR